MILINVASRLREAISDPVIDQQIDESIDKLRKYFMHPEFKALLETVGPNGEFIDTCMGRTINPGHCMETMWFLMDVAQARGGDKEILDTALTIFDWSWDWGCIVMSASVSGPTPTSPMMSMASGMAICIVMALWLSPLRATSLKARSTSPA